MAFTTKENRILCEQHILIIFTQPNRHAPQPHEQLIQTLTFIGVANVANLKMFAYAHREKIVSLPLRGCPFTTCFTLMNYSGERAARRWLAT